MTATTPALTDDEAIFDMLGQILEPSLNGTIRASDELLDELIPVIEAYRDTYDTVRLFLDGEAGDPDAAAWADADRRYDEMRDREAA